MSKSNIRGTVTFKQFIIALPASSKSQSYQFTNTNTDTRGKILNTSSS